MLIDVHREGMATPPRPRGGGDAGFAAALPGAQLGVTVPLIEGDELGGTWLHHGCSPTAQCVAVRWTQRLAEGGAVVSAGSTGDSHDNASAQASTSIVEAELGRDTGRDGHRRPRDRRRRAHRLVRPPTPARPHRPPPTGRARGALPPVPRRGDYRRCVSSEPLLDPGRSATSEPATPIRLSTAAASQPRCVASG